MRSTVMADFEFTHFVVNNFSIVYKSRPRTVSCVLCYFLNNFHRVVHLTRRFSVQCPNYVVGDAVFDWRTE